VKRKTNAAHRVTSTSAAGTEANNGTSFAMSRISQDAADASSRRKLTSPSARLARAIAIIRHKYGARIIGWGAEGVR
jgi:hypothetical protein